MILILVVFMVLFVVLFLFKQKTAYEMRISDWSSDVCSSDLPSVWNECGVLVGRPRVRDGIDLGECSFRICSQRVPIPPQIVLGTFDHVGKAGKIGRASCRERVCQYV